jgi:hypothetical protein
MVFAIIPATYPIIGSFELKAKAAEIIIQMMFAKIIKK